jgi:hypothetical protein
MTYGIIHKQLRVVKRQHQNKSKCTSIRASQLKRGVSVSTNVTSSYWDEIDNDDDYDGKNNGVDDERNDSTEGIDRHSVQNRRSSNNNNNSCNRRSRRRYNRRNFKTSSMLMKDVREIFKQHNNYPQQSHDNYPQQSCTATSNSTNKPGKAKRQLLTKQLATDSLIKETMRRVKDLKLVNTKCSNSIK